MSGDFSAAGVVDQWGVTTLTVVCNQCITNFHLSVGITVGNGNFNIVEVFAVLL